MFLLAGMYAPIMAALRDLSRLTVQWAILVPVGIGAALGIVALSKLIDMAIKRAPSVTYYAILGLLLGSVYGLWPDDWALTNPLVLIAAFAVGVAVPMLLTGGQARTASKALI
jgi:putative membrane protein